MTLLVQTVVFGVLTGGVYALMASGFTLTFGVMKVINLAHGALLILAAFLTWFVWDRTGIDPLLLGLGTSVVMFGVGWLFYKVIVARALRIDFELTMVAMFAAAVACGGLIALVAGTERRSAAPPYKNDSFALGDIIVPQAQLFASIGAVILLAGLFAVLRYTALGRSIRACAASRDGAALVGIDVERTMALMFAVGCATAGFGGAALAVLYQFVPDSHYIWIGRVLCIVVIGGLGSLEGAALGAVVLGLGEALTAAYWDTRWTTSVPYLLIIAILVLRPQGLRGTRLRVEGATA